MLGARDLRAFCRPPQGVPVEFAEVRVYADDGTPVCGLFDNPATLGMQESGLAGLIGNKPTLTLPFDAFDPMPADGDIVTVTPLNLPVPYQVGTPTAVDDGAFLVYELGAVEAPDEDAE